MPRPQYFGKHLVVGRGAYTHHGIGDERGGVIHYAGLSSGLSSGPVCRTTLKTFAQGRKITVRRYERRRYSLFESVRRARSRLGESDYSVWGNNCEHFVAWCIMGDHSSRQVDRGVAGMAGAASGGVAYAATATVSSAGVVAGLSGAGVMSGLAQVGAVVGGGAVAGLGALGAAPGVGAAAVLNKTVLKDSPRLPSSERTARRAGRAATYSGAAVGTAGGVAAVSSLGAVSGLSAAGISSGLATIGGTVGGGMVAGTAVVAAAPVAAAAVIGYGAYKLWKWVAD